MEPQATEHGTIVAPGEIRELVARLTEQSVEAIPVGEARTLEGLSVETGIPVARLRETLERMRREGRFAIPPVAWAGFVALAAVGVWAVRHTPGVDAAPPVATPVVAPAVIKPDLDGLVSLSQVTFGPEGGNLLADPNFEPSKSLPEGVSVYAGVGNVVWGSGDHHLRALDRPLSPDDADAVRSAVEELLCYVRQDASRRHLPLGPGGVNVMANTYSGTGMGHAVLPPPGAANDDAAASAGRRAARALLESLQDQLRWRDDIRREQGP